MLLNKFPFARCQTHQRLLREAAPPRHAEAEDLARRADAGLARAFGADDPRTLSNLVSLASLLVDRAAAGARQGRDDSGQEGDNSPPAARAPPLGADAAAALVDEADSLLERVLCGVDPRHPTARAAFEVQQDLIERREDEAR